MRHRFSTLLATASLLFADLVGVAAPASASETVPCPADVQGFAFTCMTSPTMAIVTGYTGTATDIVVPDRATADGVTFPVTRIGDRAFYDKHITAVVIPEGVTQIGAAAFMNDLRGESRTLTSVDLPESLTQIDENAFTGNKLTTLRLPDQVTTIGDAAFSGSYALTELTLPSELRTVGFAAFFSAFPLKKIVIPAKVSTIGDRAFSVDDKDLSRSQLTEVEFLGAAPHITPRWQGYGGSFPNTDDLRITYPRSQDASNGGNFTSPQWNGYHSATVFNVNFDTAGHGTAPTAQTVESGTPAARPEPASTGWRFVDWYADQELTTPYDFNQPVTRDTTVYASWSSTAITSIELSASSTHAFEGDAVIITATGFAADGYNIGDVSDQISLTSSHHSDVVSGNTVTLGHWPSSNGAPVEHQITARVSGVSARIAIEAAPRPMITMTTAPRIDGTGKYGSTLTVFPGSWNPPVTVGYQWLRNGTPIPGATQSNYTPGTADIGQKLSARVIVSAAGYAAASRTTATVQIKPLGTLKHRKNKKRPTVKGQAKKGKVLKVKQSTKALKGFFKRKATGIQYQWLRNGKPITGATRSKYKLTKADRKRKIRVRITATKPGYTSSIWKTKITKVK